MFAMKWQIVVFVAMFVAQTSARPNKQMDGNKRIQKRQDPCATIRCGYYATCQDGFCVCPSFCTLEYDPVCGSDGITYSNPCKLEVEACNSGIALSVAYNGECIRSTADCPSFCTLEYDPVCGSDGITYSNPCKLEVEACNSGIPISVAYDGECILLPVLCPDGSQPVACFANPCDDPENKCDAYPNAVCVADYCGGCNFLFREDGNIVDCELPDNVCLLPAVSGNCESLIPRWYYNNETNKCEEFTYGGCDGNGNNFESRADCNKECAGTQGRHARRGIF